MAAADASAPEHDDSTVPPDATAASPEAHEDTGIAVAVWTPAPDAEQLVDHAFEAARAFAASGGALLVLPELFCFPEGSLDDPLEAAEVFVPVVRALCEACEGSGLHIATSLVEAQGGQAVHVGVLLCAAGIVARQPQLEPVERYPFTQLGERQAVWDMPYGRLSLLVGDDALHPERVRAAVEQADIVACVADASGASAGWGEAPEILRAAAKAGVCVALAGGGESGGGGFVTGVAAAPGDRAEERTGNDGEAPTQATPSVVRVETEGGLTAAIVKPGARREATQAVPPDASEAEAEAEAPTQQTAASNAENIAPDEASLVNAAGPIAASAEHDAAPTTADHEATPNDQEPVNQPAGEATENPSEGQPH